MISDLRIEHVDELEHLHGVRDAVGEEEARLRASFLGGGDDPSSVLECGRASYELVRKVRLVAIPLLIMLNPYTSG